MKKSKKLIGIVSVLCLLVLLTGALAGCRTEKPANTPAVEANWDIGWYDENGKEFIISTMEELYGLAELSKTYDFKGQTIKLGADIVINEGDAGQWAEKAPEQLWNPITGFAGTFDGQGHSISGVYGNSIVTSLGLFTDTQKSCVIRDLKLVNSCFKNNNDMGTGSIIGIGGGTLKNVYSDALLVSSGGNVGGLIGSVKAKGENLISNCWFDGTITMDGYGCSGVGGLVGAYTVEDAINTIEHSLSTADINCMGENVGGLCGLVGNGAFLNLNDSMFTGTLVYDTNKYAVVGSVIGQVMNSASTIVNDTYTVDDIANRTIGTNSGYQKGNTIAVGRNYLLGTGGYQWTTLDFEKYWVAQKDGMPRLAHYTQATESIDGVQKMVDISWYDQAGASFEITNVQQLYGFAYLSRSYDFRGQTIKLGADITVNEGDASTWSKNAPAYNWTPIAWYGSSLSQRFKGTFDGQGHTVSGIYCKGTENITSLGFFGEVYHGAVVKNFKLENSYFEGVLDSSVRGPVGSIAGRLRGTIEDVYSDAILVNSAKNTGGIVGMITGTGQNKISGCWFNGEITGITRSGGILGGVYGNKGNIEATIEHCLNTGTIRVEAGQAAVGGICGSAETWSILYIKDCLNTGFYGTINSGKNSSTHIGTLLGTVTQTDGVGSKAVITNSYGVKDFYSKLVGWKFGDEGVSQRNVTYVDRQELIGYGGYKWTTLSFDDHWSVRGNACPVPVAFAPKKMSTKGLVRMVDYSWYDPAKTTYTIYNFQQLYGAARLWDIANQFKGKTIKLGMDIVLNEGDASLWGEKAPEYVWEPMRFNGTFDGQGHTISGIYVKGGEEDNYVGFFYRIYQNGTVKNLKLTNSYIEGTMPASERGAVGSLAGRSNGIIDKVYSDAIVVNSARMTGGLVGMITGEGENVIRNSWFDGRITGINRTGGILGGLYGNKADIEVLIDTCVNTGDVAVKIGSGDVGGICGIAETGGTLIIKDSLNAGGFATIGADKDANTHIGSVLGSVTEKDGVASHVVLDNVYGVEEFYSKLVGWKYGDEGISTTAAVLLDRDALTAEGGYRYTDLDFKKAYGLNAEGVPVPMAFATTKLNASDLTGQLDYSWYDESKSEYTITTAAQLEAFNVLCNEENGYFAGKTVKLGADIALTGGSETAPNWTPVTFSGTFDGQGHTVSGVYVQSSAQYNGFFHTVETGAVVKNLRLESSSVEGVYTGVESRAGVGSIVGRNRGIIDTVYSNATVRNSKAMTGGIAGMSEGGTIRNCWFDGTIYGARATGGILGGTYAKAATIEHCLNTGTLNVTNNSYYAGGICGELQNASNGQITDCLNAGTLSGTVDKSGAIVGRVDTKASLTIADAYGISEFQAAAIGDCTGKLTGSHYALRSQSDILGYGAYQWMTMDFNGGTWVLKKDAVPALGAFDTTDLSLTEAKKLPDYSWYDESSAEYVITTAQQLRGFNDLCTTDNDYFKGKTIKLGADITLNEGKAADWATKAPANVWKTVNFGGTFDGQDYTVSGLYVKATSTYTGLFATVQSGAAVKNLNLVNSYIEGNGTATRSGVGSIAGRSNGTIDTVYSDAIVRNSKEMTGGIAGMSEGGTIRNCWFDGQIDAGTSTGGILGGTYAKNVTIEHCLNTGTITVDAGSKYVGGLCGRAQNSNSSATTFQWTITDSLNAGTILKNGEGDVKPVGMIVGEIHKTAVLTLKDVYGVKDDTVGITGAAIGGKNGTVTDGSNYAVRNLADIKGYGAYQWTTLDFDGGTWVLKKNAIPALGVFDTTDLILDYAKTLPDYSWYDASKSEFVITTAGQLLGFNELGATNNFAGKTFKLGASIALSGDSKNWTPAAFSGTFDGNGKTISGIRAQGEDAGLFSTLNSGAVVKNVKIADSQITGTRTAGGIAGVADGATVSNCWFAGNVSGATAGGILGEAKNGATVEHCLNTGAVAGSATAGGLIGSAESASVSDSLNAGVKTGSAANAGTIVGEGADALTISNAYGLKEFAANAVGSGTPSAGSVDFGVVSEAKIKGYDAYFATTLDFEVKPYWVLKADAIPGLAAFDTATLTVADAKSQPDTSWYDEAADTYVISNVAQMRGYVKLREEGADFTGKTITLGADTFELSSAEQLRAFAAVCAVNDFADKTVKLTENVDLTGINWPSASFGGTFDGQKHTISGMTVSLFDKLDGATVQNLKLDNSVAAEAANSTISNCVLNNAGANILGVAKDGTTLEHCYSDGGLIADVQGTTVVKDSLAAGVPVASAADSKLTMTDVYGIGDANGSVTVGGAAYTVRKLADMQGYGAYQWTTLDFDGGKWVLKDGAIPALGAFDTTNLDLAYAKTLPDYNWYNENADAYVMSTASQMASYVALSNQAGFVDKPVKLDDAVYVYAISTAEELLAFNSLCNADTDYFNGKTVQLNNSITLTGGSETQRNWMHEDFKGTFDGNGCTISGVYVVATTHAGFFKLVHKGAVVKNLKLVDSCIVNNTASGRSGTGSIAGRCYGTIENVYSSATVKSNKGALMTGGIVGLIDKAGDNKISNCWFDGTIYGTGSTGGILGGTYGTTATLEHCLNTGSMIIVTGGANRTAIGGLCGYAQSTGGVTIRDSLNAGAIQLNPSGSNTIKQVGTIIGAIHANATSTTVGNVYGAKEFASALYGYKTATVESGAVAVVDILENLYGTGAEKLDFTTWWTAREGMIPILKRFS